jgi:hypothetical protein
MVETTKFTSHSCHDPSPIAEGKTIPQYRNKEEVTFTLEIKWYVMAVVKRAL